MKENMMNKISISSFLILVGSLHIFHVLGTEEKTIKFLNFIVPSGRYGHDNSGKDTKITAEKVKEYKKNKDDLLIIPKEHNEIITASGYTLLMAAVNYKDWELLSQRSLIASEKEINSCLNVNEENVLTLLTSSLGSSKQESNIVAFKNILEKSTPDTINFQSFFDQSLTPLHFAVKYNAQYVQLLLDYNPLFLSSREGTPLDIVINSYINSSKFVQQNPGAKLNCEVQVNLLLLLLNKYSNFFTHSHNKALIAAASKIGDNKLLESLVPYSKKLYLQSLLYTIIDTLFRNN